MSHAAHTNLAHHPALQRSNINLGEGSGKLGVPLMGVGAVLALLGVLAGASGFSGAASHHGLAAYHVGAMGVLAICLAATIFVMVFHLLNAGWTATLRRQFENIMAFLPLAWLLVFATVLLDVLWLHGKVFLWMDPANHFDDLLAKKWSYFYLPASHDQAGHFVFPTFFVARGVAMGVIWTAISRRLLALSRAQDEGGDPTLTAKARRMSAWGVLVMALSTAFAGFDWTMSLDYRFFSTMWGVYTFAGGAFALFATVILVFALLRLRGKLEGAVTEEHFHDLGKLLFSFTVFWGYIAFSQYFLIWYSNIPEETAYYVYRKGPAWAGLSAFLVVGHFAVPFLLVLSRHVKKNMRLMVLACLWCLGAHLADMFWIIRPMTYAGVGEGHAMPGAGAGVIDAVAIAGPVLLFAGYLIRRIATRPLVAVNDPWMGEGLEHKNYV